MNLIDFILDKHQIIYDINPELIEIFPFISFPNEPNTKQ